MAAVLTEIIVEATEPSRLAEFRAAVVGWERIDESDGAVEIGAPGGGPRTLLSVPLSDQKAGTNRLHLDVDPTGFDQGAEPDRVRSVGAVEVDGGQGGQTWVVPADPEGDEFCLLRRRLG